MADHRARATPRRAETARTGDAPGYRACVDRPSRFTFGTARTDDPGERTHVDLVRRAVERGAWLHGAATYGRSLEVIARVAADGHRPRLIAKSRTRTPADLRAELDQTRRRSGLARLDLVQICACPDSALLAPGNPFREALEEQVRDGLVGGYLIELFWQFCEPLDAVLTDDLFVGAVTYLSAFNRELTNDAAERLSAAEKWLVALRPFCGGRLLDAPTVVAERGKREERDGRHDAKFASLGELASDLGIASLRELSLRFLLASPEVATVVGSTRRRSHLESALDDVERLDPLPSDGVDRIRALHAEWWSEAGAGYTPNTSTELPVEPTAPAGSAGPSRAGKTGLGARLRRLFGG